MKKLIICFILIISIRGLMSCKNKPEEPTYEEIAAAQERVDKHMKDAMFDTVGLSESPVVVTKSWLYKEEYSTFKNIAFTYKNKSDKKIDAVRFRWYGLDAFGEPAEMGTSIVEGFGTGYDDDAISPGKSRTVRFSIYSSDAKKIVLVWPYEVAFADGTKWEVKK